MKKVNSLAFTGRILGALLLLCLFLVKFSLAEDQSDVKTYTNAPYTEKFEIQTESHWWPWKKRIWRGLVRLKATNTEIGSGETTELHWVCKKMHKCIIKPDIGVLDNSGSGVVEISPTETTKYTLMGIKRFWWWKKISKASVIIHVTSNPPEVSLGADPTSINIGESTILTWKTVGAETVTIEPGIGAVAQEGSMTVTPIENTTYTITATGPGGTVTATVNVDVVGTLTPGIHYQYDELGRIKQIIRVPAEPNP